MIDPTDNDIGRPVVLYSKFGDDLLPAYGWLAGFDAQQCFVSLGEGSNVIAVWRADLNWAEPERAPSLQPPEIGDAVPGGPAELRRTARQQRLSGHTGVVSCHRKPGHVAGHDRAFRSPSSSSRRSNQHL
jgi:hypothetical protein